MQTRQVGDGVNRPMVFSGTVGQSDSGTVTDLLIYWLTERLVYLGRTVVAIAWWRWMMVLIATLALQLWPVQRLFAQTETSCPGYYLSPQQRIGINVAREGGKEITDYAVEALGLGWYLDYTRHEEPAHPATSAPPGQMAYIPMIRPSHFGAARSAGTLTPVLTQKLSTAVANNPGSTWLLGNEPDNQEQDHLTPAAYAEFYHSAYAVIKGLDPSAQIAIAPVTQVTPLRLRYLDAILAAYQSRYGQPMPVDIWTVHIYMLPEGFGTPVAAGVNNGEISPDAAPAWGIGVPPGLEEYAAEAVTFTQEQHDDLHLFAEQVIGMRAWLAERGYREKPLYLTEYGILLSPDHGFDEARVEAFLLGSTAWLQGAKNPLTGFPADNNQLVQRWAWFSLNFYSFDPTPGSEHGLEGLNGNFFEHGSGTITTLGKQFKRFMDRLHSRTVDLAFETNVLPSESKEPVSTPPALTIVNRGDATANGFRLRLWWGKTPIETVAIEDHLLPHCGNRVTIPLQWEIALGLEASQLRLQLLPSLGQVEYDIADNTTFVEIDITKIPTNTQTIDVEKAFRLP